MGKFLRTFTPSIYIGQTMFIRENNKLEPPTAFMFNSPTNPKIKRALKIWTFFWRCPSKYDAKLHSPHLWTPGNTS
jgi:hypothetical protein